MRKVKKFLLEIDGEWFGGEAVSNEVYSHKCYGETEAEAIKYVISNAEKEFDLTLVREGLEKALRDASIVTVDDYDYWIEARLVLG